MHIYTHTRMYARIHTCGAGRARQRLSRGGPYPTTLPPLAPTTTNQNEIEIHNDLSERDYVTTLIHEFVHVKQNVNGVTDDTIREGEAYELENTLADIYLTGNSYRMLKQC